MSAPNPYSAVIEALPGNNLLLLPDAPKYTMVAASKEYFTSTNTTGADLNKGIFETFLGNPVDNGKVNLSASFERVLKHRQPDKVEVIRFDLEASNGQFDERYWQPINSPIFNEHGEIVYILHTVIDITDQVLATKSKEALKNLQQVQDVFTQTPIAICILKGLALIVELANEATLELWGRGNDVIGKPLLQAVPEVQGQGYIDLITDVFQSGKSHQVYESAVTVIKNGKEEVVYLNYIYQPYYEADKTVPVGVLSIGIDVTERVLVRKQLEEKRISLQESNEKLNSFLEAVPQIIWTNTPGGEIDFFNQQWFNYTGLTYQESKEWGWQAVIHPDDLATTMSIYSEKLGNGEEIVLENRFKRYDGEYRWQLNRAIPIKDNDGAVKFWIGTSTDIQDRKLAEEALKQSEQQTRSLVESAPFPIGVYRGREMRIQLTNQSIIDTWGKGSDLIGKTYFEVLPELSNQNIYQKLDDVYTTGIPFHAKNQRVDLVVDGKLQPFYFNYSFTPLFNADGNVYGVMNTAADVTDLAIAKQQIEISEQNLKNVILQAPVAMCLLKGIDNIVDIANERMLEIWGKRGPELLNKPLFEGLPEAKNQGFEQLLERVYKTGETFTAMGVPASLTQDGELKEMYLNFVYEALRGDNGEVSGIMAVAVEVTEQVLAQKKIEDVVANRTAELAEANQELKNTNASLEQFAYAASHDMQEPLRKIETFSNLLEREKDQLSEKGQSMLSKINTSASRMKTIIHDLLQYSDQKMDGTLDHVDLNEVVTQVKNDLEITIQEKNVQIIAEPLPFLDAVKGQMNQLFYNLIINSIKFAKKDTPPQIHIAANKLSEVDIKATKELDPDKNYLQIKLKDNGIGFDQRYADKIFHLFSRLHGKAEYEGTGIGLGLCKKIVQNHKGHIYAISQIGEGATFYVILPAR
jgi:PAS domain S-box-containing protein